jgi:hypothetical protein
MGVPNLWRVVMNLAGVGLRRAERQGRRLSRLAQQAAKRINRVAELAYHAPRHVRAQWDRSRADLVRRRNRLRRLDDHVIKPIRMERRIKRTMLRSARGGRPLIVGPWTSEVGYEALYWVPFLRWAAQYYRVEPERIIAISRGGSDDWYTGVAGRYVDVFDLVEPSVFAAQAAARRERGDQKQMDASDFDRELIARVQTQIGSDAALWHPGMMYQMFRPFWYGDRSLEFFLRHTDFRYAPMRGSTGSIGALPADYVAVKFYTGPAVPDTPGNRAALRGLVSRLAHRSSVVVLDTAWSTDEHRDYAFDDIPGVTTLRPSLDPRTNLGVQTRVITGARQFVGTCGGLAWLAPFLGVPTVAVYEDDRYLTAHLYAARYAYRRYQAARFSTLNLKAIRGVEAAFAKAS